MVALIHICLIFQSVRNSQKNQRFFNKSRVSLVSISHAKKTDKMFCLFFSNVLVRKMGYRKQVILKNFLIVFKTIKIIDTQLILLAILKWHSWLSNRINRLNKWINIGTNIFVVFITPFWNLRGKLKSSQILTDVNKMELPGWFWWQKIDLSSKSSRQH